MTCSYCSKPLSQAVAEYSLNSFNVQLCRSHQHWFTKALNEDHNTKFVLQLFVRLRELGANPFLNKWDGYKTVDIAIEKAGIHIEVDGVHHNQNPLQAMSDLKRTYYDMEFGIYTLRIPNSLIRENLYECADYIMRIVEMRMGYSIRHRSRKRQSF